MLQWEKMAANCQWVKMPLLVAKMLVREAALREKRAMAFRHMSMQGEKWAVLQRAVVLRQ